MKRIFLLFALFIGFAITASAQDKANSSEERIIAYKIQTEKDINTFAQVMGLDQQAKGDYMTLMMMRYEALNQVTTLEDKKAVFAKYTLKMTGAFKPESLEAFKAKDPKAYKRLMEFKE